MFQKNINMHYCKKFYNKYFWQSLFVILLFNLIYINFYKAEYYMHSDIVNEMTYKQLMWETKTFFPDGFYHTHELLTTHAPFFYILAYAVTNNFVLSNKISVTLNIFLQLYAFAFLLKKLDFDKSSIFFTLSCFIGVLNVLTDIALIAYDCYAYFVVANLISLGIIIDLQVNIKKASDFKNKKNFLKLLLLILIPFYMGYGSPRMILVCYMPLLFVEFFLYLRKHFNKQEFIIDKHIYLALLLLVLLAINTISYYFSIKSGLNFYPVASELSSLNNQLEWSNFANRFKELLFSTSLWYPLDHSVILNSKAGLFHIASVINTFIFFIFLYYSKVVYKNNEKYSKILYYWVMVTFLVFFYLLGKAEMFTPRYYFVSCLLMYVILGIIRKETHKSKLWWAYIYDCWFIILIVLFLSIGGKVVNYHHNNNLINRNLINCARYLQTEGYKVVAATYWNAGVIKAYSNNDIATKHFNGVFNPFFWMIDGSVFNKHQDVPNILLLTQKEYNELKDNEFFSRIMSQGEKIASFGDIDIFRFEKNFIYIFSFPKHVNEEQRWDFQFWRSFNGMIFDKEKNTFTSDVTGGVFFGPYLPSVNGVYDFCLEYEVLESNNENIGDFRITTNRGKSILAQKALSKNVNQITLENVKFKSENFVETVGYAFPGNVVEFKSITITKKE